MDINGLGFNSYYNDLASQAASKDNQISGMTDEDMRSKSDEELMEVCKSFEAYFLEQVFKEMNKTTSFFGKSEGSSAAMVDYFTDMTIAELAEQSTEQNSLGLANILYEQMKRNYNL